MVYVDPSLYRKYSKAEIEKAVEVLTYKKVDPLPKTETPNKPIMYVFRHGQSHDNFNMIFSGWRDVEITGEGKKQALILADKLKDKKIDMLIASNQKRAIETMKLAISKNENAKNLEIHKDPRIKERSYGILQGKSKLEYYMENSEKLHDLRRSFDTKVEEGESIKEVCERVAKFCKEIVKHMKEFNINVAVSCHGNSMRGFRKYFEHLNDDEIATIETPLGQDYAAYTIE
jgi:2,3-bisphosphoglycerate-dependent phosphoglycerate mutase